MANPNIVNCVEVLSTDASINTRLNALRALTDPNAGVVGASDSLPDVSNPNELSHLLELGINGLADMKEQKFIVQYLRNDQLLLLPTALGMTVAGDGFANNIRTLQDRYKCATTMTYATIRNFIVPEIKKEAILKAMNDGPMPEVNALKQDWRTDTWFTYGNNEIEEPTRGAVVMDIFSQCLQFNCDIRDYGMLNSNDMTVADGAWIKVDDVPLTRLSNKLKPLTMQNIAALNYPHTHMCALAAWVRAYGVGIGMLPNAASACIKEYTFTTLHPTDEHRNKVIEYDHQFEGSMITLCAQILAMFGLFNLNNEHIYQINDSNIIRLGKSYIETLRTDTNANVVKYMIRNMEAIVRTGPHPFGLAQTYWLAKVMFVHTRLMAPLAIKIDTTPPPVQKVMVCDSLAREWDVLPPGKLVSEYFHDELDLIRNAVTTIKGSPPEYSSLATLYGVASQVNVNDDVKNAVEKMMPCVIGYISATRLEENMVKDGLGFALNLQNIDRDARGLTMSWAHVWEKYISMMDDIGIKELLANLRIAKQGHTGFSGICSNYGL